MTCPDCERYKKSAAMWRNKAYEASGHPLPWKPDELWQGLTDEEINNLWDGHIVPVFGKNGINPIVFARAIEAKLKEKNNT
jgi:hypothetical protein